MKIGIFDSGVGGLAIAEPVWREFSGVEIFYIADKAFSPYGQLNEQQINERVLWCAQELERQQVDLIIIACNTATAAGVELLRKKYNFPVIGVEPDINFYQRGECSKVDLQKICVLCTPYTLKSLKFNNLKNLRDPEGLIHYKAMKNLARLVEDYFWSENLQKSKELLIDDLNKELNEDNFEYFVMGCTHYELIKDIIEKHTGAKAIGVADGIVKRCKQLFKDLKKMDGRVADSCGGFYFYDTNKPKWASVDLAKFISWPRE